MEGVPGDKSYFHVCYKLENDLGKQLQNHNDRSYNMRENKKNKEEKAFNQCINAVNNPTTACLLCK